MSKGISSQATRRATPEAGPVEVMSRPAGGQFKVPITTIQKVEADGVRLFYRAAGDATAPVVLLLHGFPTSSFMFRELIPRLSDRYRVIAPDLPGFGFTEVPGRPEICLLFRRIGQDNGGFHRGDQNQPLCNLRFRLWRAHRLSLGDGSPGPSHSDRFTKWECI